MKTYTVRSSHADDSCSGYEQFQAADDESAKDKATEITRQWIASEGAEDAGWLLYRCPLDEAMSGECEPIEHGWLTATPL